MLPNPQYSIGLKRILLTTSSQIDFKAVAEERGIKSAAAYMRFSRLKKQIDNYNAGKSTGSTAADDKTSAPSTPAKSTEGKSQKSSGKTPKKASGATPAKRGKVAETKEEKDPAPKDEDGDENESEEAQVKEE